VDEQPEVEDPQRCDLPGGALMGTLPKLDSVSESTIREFLRIAAGNLRIDDTYPLPKILDSEGRCIRVQVTGTRLNWHNLAERLLGACRPCEEFRVERNYINARLKTSAQIEADGLACDVDEKYSDTRLQTYWPFFDEQSAPSEPRNARQLGQANRKTEKRAPEGLAQDIMKAMKQECALGTIDTEELVLRVKKRIPKKLDSEGRDRRSRNIRIAIDKLVSLELLHLHGEDQDELSLSSLIVEDDDAEKTDT
jgi:hypothetical protein